MTTDSNVANNHRRLTTQRTWRIGAWDTSVIVPRLQTGTYFFARSVFWSDLFPERQNTVSKTIPSFSASFRFSKSLNVLKLLDKMEQAKRMQYLKIICIPGLPRDSGMKQFSSVFPDGFLENFIGVRSMLENFLSQRICSYVGELESMGQEWKHKPRQYVVLGPRLFPKL